MLRYFIIATIIVVGIFIAAAALHEAESRFRATSGHGHPARSAMIATRDGRGNAAVRGDAPWALSALPECMIQTTEGKGSLRTLLAHLPHNAQEIVPPATLHYSDCTLSISGDQALVSRGEDRLRIPPVARFYRFDGGIVLLRTPECRPRRCPSTMRIYRTVQP